MDGSVLAMRILVPLDGSLLAESALQLAAGLARAREGEILIVRVIDPHAPLPAGPLGLVSRYRDSEREAAVDDLERVTRQLTRWGLHGTTRLAWGQPVAQIVRVAREEQATLIVMASHGRSGPGRWLLGSVTEGVLRLSPCPVLIGRGSLHHEFAGFRQVVVPLDGSQNAAEVLPAVQPYLHREARGTLVRSSDDLVRQSALRLDEQAYRAYQATLQAELTRALPPDSWRWEVLDCPPAEAILRVAEADQADLIAMSTHGRTGFHRLLLGSVTERVARHAPCSVLAFPARCLSIAERIEVPLSEEPSNPLRAGASPSPPAV